jgi:AcrR family transcriptional regulator
MEKPREQMPPASERIAVATLSLVAERGLGGVTMSAIARAAGVARQTLYNHYSDVEAIVSAVIAQHQEESVQRLGEMLATVAAPQDRLEHLVRHTAATAHGHPSLRHGFSAEVQAIVDGYDQAMRSHIETIIRDGVEQEIFRHDLEPAVDALVVQRMIEATGELVSADPDAATGIVTSVSAAVLAAVTAR